MRSTYLNHYQWLIIKSKSYCHLTTICQSKTNALSLTIQFSPQICTLRTPDCSTQCLMTSLYSLPTETSKGILGNLFLMWSMVSMRICCTQSDAWHCRLNQGQSQCSRTDCTSESTFSLILPTQFSTFLGMRQGAYCSTYQFGHTSRWIYRALGLCCFQAALRQERMFISTNKMPSRVIRYSFYQLARQLTGPTLTPLNPMDSRALRRVALWSKPLSRIAFERGGYGASAPTLNSRERVGEVRDGVQVFNSQNKCFREALQRDIGEYWVMYTPERKTLPTNILDNFNSILGYYQPMIQIFYQQDIKNKQQYLYIQCTTIHDYCL